MKQNLSSDFLQNIARGKQIQIAARKKFLFLICFIFLYKLQWKSTLPLLLRYYNYRQFQYLPNQKNWIKFSPIAMCFKIMFVIGRPESYDPYKWAEEINRFPLTFSIAVCKAGLRNNSFVGLVWARAIKRELVVFLQLLEVALKLWNSCVEKL